MSIKLWGTAINWLFLWSTTINKAYLGLTEIFSAIILWDFDLSLAAYNSVSFSVGSQETVPLWINISDDWTKMYIAWASWDDISQWTLWTAYDVSWTMTYNGSWNSPSVTDMRSISFKPDWTNQYTTGSTNYIL